MHVPFFQVGDVWALPGGDAVLSGTDDFLADGAPIDAEHLRDVTALVCQRGGRRIEISIRAVEVRMALSGKRNIHARVAPWDWVELQDAMRGIVMLPEELLRAVPRTTGPVRIGFFRELGHDDADAPSLIDSRGERRAPNKDRVLQYLRTAGRPMVVSPGPVADYFDRASNAGTMTQYTDGIYVWPNYLAHYVDRYDVALPEHFEAHMAARNWSRVS